ncbi:MAG: right-handed parallel beta-helix repeat-containing protein [Oscillospiraceae bacterium]|nr:right-handed parallel beta-helix repeat-containing protein [Oscillospiraceae bacterium]
MENISKKIVMLAFVILSCLSPVVGLSGCAKKETDLTYYVAATGSDENDGTLERPFATLEKARDEIRNIQNKDEYTKITVYMRGGEYVISSSFALDSQDSGTESCPITYASYPGEEAHLYGGVLLPGAAFGPVTDEAALQRLPAQARDIVRQIDLRKLGVSDFGELNPTGYSYPATPQIYLYSDGKIQTIARYPNNGGGELTTETLIDRGRVFNEGNFGYIPDADDPAERGGGKFAYSGSEISAERAAAWKLETATAILYGGWAYAWAPDGVFMRDIDPGEGTIELANTTTYGVAEGQKFYAYNLLCELDSPGEYYIDRTNGLLFYYPYDKNEKIENETLEIAVLSEPFITASNTSHIDFSELWLEMGKDSGIIIDKGEHMTITNCTIRNMEKNGISLGEAGAQLGGGYNNAVKGCHIYNIGEHGIYAESAPGDRRNLKLAECEISGNTIHSFAQIVRSYKNAVRTDGCGYLIANNLIYDAPTQAINYNGNDIIIEYNEIYDVVQEQDDSGAIYTFGDYTFVNCKIRYNYIHSLASAAEENVGVMAIYIDFCAGDVEIYGNTIANVKGHGIWNNGGQRVKIFNNVLVNISERSICNGAFGTYFWKSTDSQYAPGWQTEAANEWFETPRKWLEDMKPSEEPWASAYPWVKDIFTSKWETDPADIPKGNIERPDEIKEMPGETWDASREYLSREPYSYWLPVGSECYENYIINGFSGDSRQYIALWVDRPNTETWNNQANYWKFDGHYYDFGAVRDNRIVDMDSGELAQNFRDYAKGDYTLMRGGSVLTELPEFLTVDFSDIGPIVFP